MYMLGIKECFLIYNNPVICFRVCLRISIWQEFIFWKLFNYLFCGEFWCLILFWGEVIGDWWMRNLPYHVFCYYREYSLRLPCCGRESHLILRDLVFWKVLLVWLFWCLEIKQSLSS